MKGNQDYSPMIQVPIFFNFDYDIPIGHLVIDERFTKYIVENSAISPGYIKKGPGEYQLISMGLIPIQNFIQAHKEQKI